MSSRKDDSLPALNIEELVKEVAGANLGDERLNERFMKVMESLASSPSASFASMCNSKDEREGLYRFMRNKHVLWPDLIEPHIEETRVRASKAGAVIVVHDTTTVRVAEDADLESYLNTGKKGFLFHSALVLDGREERKPLGTSAVEIVFRAKGKAKTKKNGRALSGAETFKFKHKEFDRWWRLVEKTEERLQDVETVHVMDREADSYDLLSRLVSSNTSFVIRWCRNRSAKFSHEESMDWSKVKDLLCKAKTKKLKRVVHLGKRRKKTAPRAAKAAPPRKSRSASLRFATCSLDLRKPHYLPTRLGYPDSLAVNVVHIYEPSPPEGYEPVEWVLLTNLPIKKARDVERVVDIYRQRWLIEEFFKAIKTGCLYRKRHLTNRQSILNTFSSFLPIAWKALLLRSLAQGAPMPASHGLSSTELDVLRAKAMTIGAPLGENPTMEEALTLIARLGGYRSSSGPPGWLTIMRGTEKFISLVEGWSLAHAQM